MAKNAIAVERDWQVEDDLRTLERAREIENDPKRMKKCQELATEKMKSMGAIASESCDE